MPLGSPKAAGAGLASPSDAAKKRKLEAQDYGHVVQHAPVEGWPAIGKDQLAFSLLSLVNADSKAKIRELLWWVR